MVNNIRIKLLFNIYGRKTGSGFAGNVYSTDGISNTLTTMGGGDREPMIIEYMEQEKYILQKKDYWGGRNTRLFKDYSPTMCCNYFSDCVPYVIEIINE